MTTKELIDVLSTYGPDSEVHLENYADGLTSLSLEYISEVIIAKHPNGKYIYLGLSEYADKSDVDLHEGIKGYSITPAVIFTREI